MKKTLIAAALVLASQFALITPAAVAADAKPVTAQQQRMKDCNGEAKGMKGQERKDFMKGCLGGKKAEAKDARATQQNKMKACNAEAKTKALKGPERKAFMSDCLKAD
jgi:hypothetical protein